MKKRQAEKIIKQHGQSWLWLVPHQAETIVKFPNKWNCKIIRKLFKQKYRFINLYIRYKEAKHDR
jgi:hypothetical protein